MKKMKKQFVKENTIITIENGGMVRTEELRDCNYPPVWIKSTCLYAWAIKKLIKDLLAKGYREL